MKELFIIEKLHELTEKIAGKTVPIELTRNAFFFVLASIAGLSRIKHNVMCQEQFINFFGISIAPSGIGKDTALKATEIMFDDILQDYVDIAKIRFVDTVEDPDGEDNEYEKDYIVPLQYKVPLRGSIEGMMRVANFYNRTSNGSLNVVSTEFGNEFNSEVIPILTSLWQDAKADGSTNVNEKYPPIKDVPTNVLLFGSPSAFYKHEKRHNALAEAIESGFARRTFFVWIERPEIRFVERNPDINMLKEAAEQIKENIRLLSGKHIEWSQQALDLINDYKNRLLDEYNANKTDWLHIKLASTDKTQRLASLAALANVSAKVEVSDVEYAINVSEKSFEDMQFIVAPMSQFKRMYNILSTMKDGMSIAEMNDLGVRFKTKKEEEYQLELLDHYAFKNSKRLVKKGMKYIIDDLPKTDINKIIVSVNTQGKGKFGTEAEPMELPMFDDPVALENLVRSDKADWFIFAHFDPARRGAKNAVKGQNCIAFDIDSGMSIDDALDLFNDYTYLIYTTKSHMKNKGGIVCDRFRIILPTKYKFYVDNEQHKGMIENVAKMFEIPMYDKSASNIDRIWFPNPEAEVYKNEGELLDVTCCIPETTREELTEKLMSSVSDDQLSLDRRIRGMQRWTIANAVEGQRNMLLFRLYKFVEDLTGSSEEAAIVTRQTNAMLHNPLTDKELDGTILRNHR